MIRPRSIINFERCYLGALIISVVNTATSWTRLQSAPEVVRANAEIGAWYTPTVTSLGLLMPLILWYFVARRASAVAKWIVVVLFALGVASILLALMMGTVKPGFGGILTAISIILQTIAVISLFKPDAKTWFGEDVQLKGRRA